ncbi:MAG: urea transporter [Bdellovibrio sp.]|nr:urea transporter [Bdellovibrio sp.]
MTKVRSFTVMLGEFFAAFHSIVLLGYLPVGFLIALLTWTHPNIAVLGLIGLGTAWVVLKIFRFGPHFQLRGAVLYNALLVGLYTGFLFSLNWGAAGLAVLAASLSVVLTFFLQSLFFPLGLPVLSFPFTIVGAFLALSAPKFTNLIDASYYFKEGGSEFASYVPVLVSEGLRSMGALFCIPDWSVGLGILAVIFIFSPLTALFLSSGLAVGISCEHFLAFSAVQVPMDHHFFNYALIFASLAGVFLIPSLYSIAVAAVATLIGVLVTTASATFWGMFAIPVLALPFNLTLYFVLRTLKTAQVWQLSVPGGASPEAALDRARLLWLRHRTGELGVFCPFEGEWVVQQGFNGAWTHQGNWRHALDFVKQDVSGKTYKNQGLDLEDYYAFGQPVFSPVEGYVVSAYSQGSDNPIGKVENQRNWGNYVTLRTLSGTFVTVAHLKKDSVLVGVGEYVPAGKKIGACGNSGYSQEPHIHLQAQFGLELGAFTHPFHLLNFCSRRTVHVNSVAGFFHHLPGKGDWVSPMSFNLALDRLLTFKVGETQIWSRNGNAKSETIRFEHLLDSVTGIPYWTDGKAKLFYSRFGAQFYFHGHEGSTRSPLNDLFLAAPRIPIGFGKKIRFKEHLPLQLTHGVLRRFFLVGRQLLTSKLFGPQAVYRVSESGLQVKGCILFGDGTKVRTHFEIDPVGGAMRFRVGRRIYVRVDRLQETRGGANLRAA